MHATFVYMQHNPRMGTLLAADHPSVVNWSVLDVVLTLAAHSHGLDGARRMCLENAVDGKTLLQFVGPNEDMATQLVQHGNDVLLSAQSSFTAIATDDLTHLGACLDESWEDFQISPRDWSVFAPNMSVATSVTVPMCALSMNSELIITLQYMSKTTKYAISAAIHRVSAKTDVGQKRNRRPQLLQKRTH